MNLEKPYSLYELTSSVKYSKIYVITKNLNIYHVRTEGCGDSTCRNGVFISDQTSGPIQDFIVALRKDSLDIESKLIKTMDEDEVFLEIL